MGIELRSNGSYSVKVIKTPELFKARKLFLEALVKVKKQREEKANGEKSENDGTGLDDIVSDL
jgi:hypothetical protein